MKVVKLTKKAQDIVNQIMSADAVDVDHGPVGERIAYGNMHLTGEGLEFNVNVDVVSHYSPLTNRVYIALFKRNTYSAICSGVILSA